MSKKGKIFLSYARSDHGPVQQVGTLLREAGLDVWDPEREILPGADWSAELKSALDSSQAVVVFISPEAMESRSVSHEIEYALGAKHLSGRLIPVVLRPTKSAPWILNSLQSIRHESPAKTGQEIMGLLNQGSHVPQAKRRAY